MPLRALVGAPADLDAVALTFDDALASFAEIALPLLVEHGLPGTLFVVTSRAGSTNDWTGRGERGIPTFPLMSWAELAEALESGIELGAHSRTHPRLTTLPDDLLEQELSGSAADLERHTGARPRTFCYPYGDVDDRVTAAASNLFDLACTTRLDVLADDALHRLPRLDMVYFRDPRRLEAWGSAAFLRYVRFRAAARHVRAALSRRPTRRTV